eukprot:m.67336 g.67336  ORF g.67336 m.67336 type:complete len:292 (-) comp23798_c0_seq1:241-1116(-)
MADILRAYSVKPDEILFAGFLCKSPPLKNVDEQKLMKRWQKRWFILSATHLRYYVDETEEDMKGEVDLVGSSVTEVVRSDKFDHVFSVNTTDRCYFMQANSDSEREMWASKIDDVVNPKLTPLPKISINDKPPPKKPSAAAPSAPPPPTHVLPPSNTYKGPTSFQVGYEGQWAELQIKSPRLNLLRTVNRGRPPTPVSVITETWPLAGLTTKTYKQEDNTFSFKAGALDPVPGHIYAFGLQEGDDIVGAIEGVRAGNRYKYAGERAASVNYTQSGLRGKTAAEMNMEGGSR